MTRVTPPRFRALALLFGIVLAGLFLSTDRGLAGALGSLLGATLVTVQGSLYGTFSDLRRSPYLMAGLALLAFPGLPLLVAAGGSRFIPPDAGMPIMFFVAWFTWGLLAVRILTRTEHVRAIGTSIRNAALGAVSLATIAALYGYAADVAKAESRELTVIMQECSGYERALSDYFIEIRADGEIQKGVVKDGKLPYLMPPYFHDLAIILNISDQRPVADIAGPGLWSQLGTITARIASLGQVNRVGASEMQWSFTPTNCSTGADPA